jgi:hypothetical protein
MTGRRVVGLILAVVGLVALLWGGVFWKTRDTVLDAGPIHVTTERDKGFTVPPLVGGVCLAIGVVLLVFPGRRA